MRGTFSNEMRMSNGTTRVTVAQEECGNDEAAKDLQASYFDRDRNHDGKNENHSDDVSDGNPL